MYNVSAELFGDAAPLDVLNDKWFLNLSDVDIPLEVQCLLQLGEGFGLPINKHNLDRTLIEFIKNIENNIIGRQKNLINFVRNNSVLIIDKFRNDFPKNDLNDKLLCDWVRTTKRFVKDHPEILISKADKGNVTVAQNKFEYISKMESMLSDKNTYKLITKDPTKKLTGELRNLLGRWKGKGVIDDLTYRRLRTTDGVIPRAYGVTKIHKQNYPLRIIVSSVNSPLYNLALFLHGIIADSIPETPSFIKNSYDLINKLKNVKLESDSVLVSLDVVSLFANIPIDLASDSVVVRWVLYLRKLRFRWTSF